MTTTMELIKKLRPYIVSIAISLGVGLLSALITKGDMAIYEQITKPPLAPPALAFPIAWTILYTLMGISSARIYLKRNESKGRPCRIRYEPYREFQLEYYLFLAQGFPRCIRMAFAPSRSYSSHHSKI